MMAPFLSRDQSTQHTSRGTLFTLRGGRGILRSSDCRIVNILPYRAGAKRHSVGLMHRGQHYILWSWIFMQLDA